MIEYEIQGDVIQCWTERETGPFDKVLIGSISKGDDGHYRLKMSSQVVLTCGHLTRLAHKIGKLNA